MEIKIQVLIPIVVILVLLIIAVIIILCRFYLWKYIFKQKHQYSKLQSPGVTNKSQRHPQMPIITATPPPFTYNKEKQSSRYLNRSPNYLQQGTLSGNQSDASGDLFHFDDSRSSVKSSGSEYDGGSYPDTRRSYPDSEKGTTNSHPNKLTKNFRTRFKSEPILNKDYDTTAPVAEVKRRRFSKRSKSRMLSVVAPASAQIEFSLFYEPDEKSLIINVVQIVDIVLRPECFLGILDVYNKNEHHQSTMHLIRNSDDTLELSDYSESGFLLYVTLLPKRNFCKHTSVVFGEQSAVFNEKFTVHGHTLEQLSQSYLCMHALCKFGRDGEPIVLGEVKVPLKRLQVSQMLPFMANLGHPEEELVLQSHLKPATDLGFLEIYISFNPMAQTLVVKIIQATGLPKIGVTGNPNISVKTALYYCNLRASKKTTSIQKRQRDPVFNETFEFQLSKDRISECDVLFEIRHHGPMYRSVIGYVIVGNSAGGEGTKQWRQLLDFSYHEKVYKIMANKPVGLS